MTSTRRCRLQWKNIFVRFVAVFGLSILSGKPRQSSQVSQPRHCQSRHQPHRHQRHHCCDRNISVTQCALSALGSFGGERSQSGNFVSSKRCITIIIISTVIIINIFDYAHCPLSSPPAPNKQKSPCCCCCCCCCHDENNNNVDQPSSHPRGVERPAWDLAVEVNSH